jgi:hypothetical protein
MTLAKTRVREPADARPKAGVDFKVVTLRLDPITWQRFRDIARDNGQSIVGRLRVMVRRDVEAEERVVSESA